tara:strand:- start:1199 stop:2245 length:1047 start_codon:yes stop_codon:yes gene_type:complete
MLNNKIKVFIKKFPFIWNFLRSLKLVVTSTPRLKDVFMMLILFHLWPNHVYRFSTRKLLPSKKNRFSKNLKPIIPYEIIEKKTSKIDRMKEVNIIAAGLSFDLNKLKEIKGPTFLVPSWLPLKIDSREKIIRISRDQYQNSYSEYASGSNHKYDRKNMEILKDFKRENIIYTTSREKYLKNFEEKGYKTLSVETYGTTKDGSIYPLDSNWEGSSYLNIFDSNNCMRISLREKIYQPPLLAPYSNWTPTQSFLPALCALLNFADKINVYGWDFYLDREPNKMNHWELFFNMYNVKLDVLRSNHYFESALINFYYAYQFSKLPNVNINGYMGQLDKHEKLIKKIERVLFN